MQWVFIQCSSLIHSQPCHSSYVKVTGLNILAFFFLFFSLLAGVHSLSGWWTVTCRRRPSRKHPNQAPTSVTSITAGEKYEHVAIKHFGGRLRQTHSGHSEGPGQWRNRTMLGAPFLFRISAHDGQIYHFA